MPLVSAVYLDSAVFCVCHISQIVLQYSGVLRFCTHAEVFSDDD